LAASLSIAGLEAGYGAVRVLHAVSVTLGAGETVALLGTNGNGKSTLMQCVMGIVRPTGGTIVAEIDGARHDLVGRSTEAIVDLGIAFVPEGRRLFPRLTVTENLLMGAFRRAARATIGRNLEFCLETFPRLKERRRQLAGNMSGGEQQMLALARAFVHSPRVILVDEASLGLAPLVVDGIFKFLAGLKAKGASLLIVDQFVTRALSIADRVYVMNLGEIVFEGAPRDLEHDDVFERYLGTA
jgi:branched-chain amino acid transport system ATP-binding protein